MRNVILFLSTVGVITIGIAIATIDEGYMNMKLHTIAAEIGDFKNYYYVFGVGMFIEKKQNQFFPIENSENVCYKYEDMQNLSKLNEDIKSSDLKFKLQQGLQ
ncbi:hypothetical protein PPERSA_04047 [Pseudocohnilembus persalinus]|uniref:Uncharacterized protein n=1 Tax=Pseudocohnilembus persalinus TaxID=266149 RepID=A0A0V0QL50_PSEPJ|nr:hypothetical protein PPERSA_04047 [Pseudocohnilembus persalinus]|eukprot:KRX02844.1 hypothetical protein PPERSA_04047 [Pseudocohnilembus persalinus]